MQSDFGVGKFVEEEIRKEKPNLAFVANQSIQFFIISYENTFYFLFFKMWNITLLSQINPTFKLLILEI